MAVLLNIKSSHDVPLHYFVFVISFITVGLSLFYY